MPAAAGPQGCCARIEQVQMLCWGPANSLRPPALALKCNRLASCRSCVSFLAHLWHCPDDNFVGTGEA